MKVFQIKLYYLKYCNVVISNLLDIEFFNTKVRNFRLNGFT